MKIKEAKAVPYSSVVGQSVTLHNEDGAVLALLMISVPNPQFDYRTTADLVTEHLLRAFNSPPSLVDMDFSKLELRAAALMSEPSKDEVMQKLAAEGLTPTGRRPTLPEFQRGIATKLRDHGYEWQADEIEKLTEKKDGE